MFIGLSMEFIRTVLSLSLLLLKSHLGAYPVYGDPGHILILILEPTGA